MRLPGLVLLGVLGLWACADEAPDAAVPAAATAPGESMATKSGRSTVTIDDAGAYNAFLAGLNDRLASTRAPVRIAKAELLVDPAGWDGTSTTIFALDRVRGLSNEWVAGDPRRGGRIGLTYALDLAGARPVIQPASGGQRLATFPELEAQLEEGMAAWRDESCSDSDISRVTLPGTVDPDFIDNLFNGAPEAPGRVLDLDQLPYVDVVQGGWQPSSFFRAFAGTAGNNIIGVAFSLIWVDEAGEPTDINRDGRFDTAFVEIFYNTRFLWSNTGARGPVDFYSIITHETGHAVGLAHFGKVFVTRRDLGDGIQLEDVKYAPLALMNAVYVAGRGEITGTDRSSFCMIWAPKN